MILQWYPPPLFASFLSLPFVLSPSLSFHLFLCVSVRRGHDDLGDHYLDCGDLSNALKCYSRARDYCTSAKHVVNMCLNVIKVRNPVITPVRAVLCVFVFVYT